MVNFGPTGGNSFLFNKRTYLNRVKNTDATSFLALFLSKSLLFFGIILILLNNFNIIAPGSYFGKFSWVTFIVFTIGILLNFIFIPILYISSFKNFKQENGFWDKQTFWILPLFFFGIFFLYSADVLIATELSIFAVLVVALVHVNFILEARKMIIKDIEVKFTDCDQYFVTLKYLTVYYLIVLLFLVIYNPLEHMFFWFRMNV